MKAKFKQKMAITMMLALVLAILIGCATFTANSYKALSAAAVTYDTTMKSAADLYKQGKVTDEQKAKIVEIGNYYWAAYHVAVDALAAYEATSSAEDKDRVTVALSRMSAFLAQLVEYVTPFLDKKEG